MLGHQLFESWKNKHEVKVTLHQDASAYQKYDLFNDENAFFNVDVRLSDDLSVIFGSYQPQVIINATGIIKQRKAASDILPSLEANALFPHRASQLAKMIGARLFTFSTDCVFSGRKGNYSETDQPDPPDIYGKTKVLGELNEEHCVTLRTSFIGLELARKTGLIEWFLAQKGDLKGFTHAIYSGLLTSEIARVVENIMLNYPNLHGLWHLSSDPISKYDLLVGLSQRLNDGRRVITPDENFFCDRSLDSSLLRKEISYQPPSWDTMFDELAQKILKRGEY